uniref:Uncharacterized protein n=1 Tax=Panagrolaimus davidi TaxID=227884 RepID=A0A914P9I6_9BILA
MKRRHSSDDGDSGCQQNLSRINIVPLEIPRRLITRKDFPTDVLKYMKLNATPRMSVKLMKICKYFKHREFPFFVIKLIKHCFGEWTYITLDNITITTNSLAEIPDNLWITERIIVSIEEIDFTAFINKIIVSDAESIHFVSQTIPFNKFKHLCANVKNFNSISSYLKDDDGNDICLDEVLESLPNLEALYLNLHCPTITSLERVNRVVSPKLKVFRLDNFLENFNFGMFADFMLQHPDIKYTINSNQHLTAEYMLQLQIHVSRIISEWDCQFLPPKIDYFQQSHTSINALALLHQQYILSSSPEIVAPEDDVQRE